MKSELDKNSETWDERLAIIEFIDWLNSKEIIDNADLIVKIEQAPTYVRCLNTTIASAIVIHDWYNKMKNNDRNQYY